MTGSTGYTKIELGILHERFCQYRSSKTAAEREALFDAVLVMAKSGLTWLAAGALTGFSRHLLLAELERVAREQFDESIRWQACERTDAKPLVTGLLDHTTTTLRWSLGNAEKCAVWLSGHKGIVYKYLFLVTCQGTPIWVSNCQAGRRTDIHHLQSNGLITEHSSNDFFWLTAVTRE